MEKLRRFLAIVHADLLARFRTTGFWVLVGISAALTWLCFPPVSANYIFLGLNGHYRGLYSSAWIGMVLGMLSIWVSLIGFYMVRGTLRRDIDANVWQLLVATPLSRTTYLLAKWCSHLVVLGLIMLAGLSVGLLAQLVRAEDPNVDLIELIKPSLVLGLPSLALSAMFAIWFDMVPWLRRSAGNVVFFLIWLAILIGSVNALGARGEPGWPGDPRGMAVFDYVVREHVRDQVTEKLQPGFCLGCSVGAAKPERFSWTEWEITPQVLLGRLSWLALAMFGVALCAPWLDRAAARRTSGQGSEGADSGLQIRWLDALLRPLQGEPFGALLAAELQLTLRGRKLWWWGACLAAAAAQVFAAPEIAMLAVIAAWTLSMDIYSNAALREHETGCAPAVFCSANAGGRILLARWLALVAVGCMVTMPAIVRYSTVAPMSALAIVLIGVSLASWGLTLATLTRNPRTFELLLCVLAYLGFQESPLLHIGVAPAWTVSAHLAMLPLAALLLWVGWPRLYQRIG